MAYTPVYPLPTNQINPSIIQLRDNFVTLRTYLEHDHNTINTNGYHNKVTFLRVADPVTPIDQLALYGKLYVLPPGTNKTELCMRKENNGPIYEITAYRQGVPQGFTRLACGLLIKWGFASANGDANIAYDAAYPPFTTAVYNAQVTLYDTGAGENVNRAIRISDWTNLAQLRVYGSFRDAPGAANTVFTWLAIGI